MKSWNLFLAIALNREISSFHLKLNTADVFSHDNLVFKKKKKKSLTVKFNDTTRSSLSVRIYIQIQAFTVPSVFL